jgi:RES domain-containing protein
MLVYRITLAQYANTASSRSLACLENVVHRSQAGLNQLFKVMTIQIDDRIKKEIIKLSDLPLDWKEFYQMPLTQAIGQKWIKENRTAILEIPSSLIDEESNFLLNPLHEDFHLIKVIKSEVFVFDRRIK